MTTSTQKTPVVATSKVRLGATSPALAQTDAAKVRRV